jgi:hypothetical protein
MDVVGDEPIYCIWTTQTGTELPAFVDVGHDERTSSLSDDFMALFWEFSNSLILHLLLEVQLRPISLEIAAGCFCTSVYLSAQSKSTSQIQTLCR